MEDEKYFKKHKDGHYYFDWAEKEKDDELRRKENFELELKKTQAESEDVYGYFSQNLRQQERWDLEDKEEQEEEDYYLRKEYYEEEED